MTEVGWTHTVTGGPWPERVGLRCREVPPLADHYPWAGVGRNEVVILIEDDPLTIRYDKAGHADRGWTCVISAECLTPAAIIP